MAGSRRGHWRFPTQLSLGLFEQFVLPHLSIGRRGPAPKLGFVQDLQLHSATALFGLANGRNCRLSRMVRAVLRFHYTRIYCAWRRWEADGCIDAIFAGAVMQLHHDELLDVTVIHGDGTTTAAKKGGDNIGFNGHKKLKGDKVVAFCDRNCNVIAPFVLSTAAIAMNRCCCARRCPVSCTLPEKWAWILRAASSAWIASMDCRG